MRIVIRREDKTAAVRARQLGYKLVVDPDTWEIDGPTLFASAGIPWELVSYGFHFVERWDAAAPLWRYGVLAADVAGGEERARTERIVRDLRLLLYAPELLFVADNPAGHDLVATWRTECEADGCTGSDGRLAFLRALYLVKPMLCVLPRSWLLDPPVALPAPRVIGDPAQAARTPKARAPRPAKIKNQMVQVEIAPGRYVCCQPEEVEMYRERYAKLKVGRR